MNFDTIGLKEYSDDANCAIVSMLCSVIDMDNSRNVSRELCAVVASDDYDAFIVDMGNINYVSSTGVGAVLEAFKAAKKGLKKFALCNVVSKVYDVFALLGFSSFIDIHHGKGSYEQVYNSFVEELTN